MFNPDPSPLLFDRCRYYSVLACIVFLILSLFVSNWVFKSTFETPSSCRCWSFFTVNQPPWWYSWHWPLRTQHFNAEVWMVATLWPRTVAWKESSDRVVTNVLTVKPSEDYPGGKDFFRLEWDLRNPQCFVWFTPLSSILGVTNLLADDHYLGLANPQILNQPGFINPGS